MKCIFCIKIKITTGHVPVGRWLKARKALEMIPVLQLMRHSPDWRMPHQLEICFSYPGRCYAIASLCPGLTSLSPSAKIDYHAMYEGREEENERVTQMSLRQKQRRHFIKSNKIWHNMNIKTEILFSEKSIKSSSWRVVKVFMPYFIWLRKM